ncbi:DUF1571 domain-containing protein [Thalassoglobus polymorphus]|uniref:DUF1571 domain-containing protein n=1 Tax=Thalassoglobus polymorphus TaxID=2527994 RepID=A0A517QJ17_9PLAN|nr:DUF1571 domain-containing protein [Thalassoglobus polymorphus]QDT31537.1 hypothetical protein Mal48_07710 [Thalassoglobus polymorphus]
MMRKRRSNRYPGTNFLAVLIACGALAIAHLNSDPIAIGGSPNEESVNLMPPVLALPPTPSLPQHNAVAQDSSDDESAKEVLPAENPGVLKGIWALKMTSTLLRKGTKSFTKVTDYTASLYRQERLNGVLGTGQTIEMKLKHEPFSLYMKWLSGDEKGQQAIYVEDQNDGKLLVQPGGIKGRLTGVLKLDPEGSLAMAQSRHPATQAGLVELAKTILKFQEEDLKRGTGFQCELVDNQTFDDRPCYIFTCVYDSEEINSVYRKSVIYVDKELSMPVCVKNFCWAKDANPETIDDETLLEFYAYSGLELYKQLEVADFDAKNRSYRMRVRR